MIGPEEAIVPPIGPRGAPDLGALAVMVSTGADLELLRSRLPRGTGSSPLFTGRLFVDADSGIAAAGPMVGAPYAVMVMESLIAGGVRKILYLGWAGAVSPDVRIGDVILPGSALIDEGTSRHYRTGPGEASRPSRAMVERIRKELTARAAPFREGAVWTTDGIFRETPRKVARFREMGALAVEMETSALFTVARYRGVEAAAILVVSDDLSTLKWRPGFKAPAFKAARRVAIESLMGVIDDERKNGSGPGRKNRGPAKGPALP
ncbi:MAG: nucleoside phosphorylase [Desulfobacterales bacterium]|nr:nucleoside phosphorylase [Desulfobacterales bacterium]